MPREIKGAEAKKFLDEQLAKGMAGGKSAPFEAADAKTQAWLDKYLADFKAKTLAERNKPKDLGLLNLLQATPIAGGIASLQNVQKDILRSLGAPGQETDYETRSAQDPILRALLGGETYKQNEQDRAGSILKGAAAVGANMLPFSAAGKIAPAATTIGRFTAAAPLGAAVGGLSGYANTQGDLGQGLGDIAKGALGGAVIGGVTNAALGKVGDILGRGKKAAQTVAETPKVEPKGPEKFFDITKGEPELNARQKLGKYLEGGSQVKIKTTPTRDIVETKLLNNDLANIIKDQARIDSVNPATTAGQAELIVNANNRAAQGLTDIVKRPTSPLYQGKSEIMNYVTGLNEPAAVGNEMQNLLRRVFPPAVNKGGVITAAEASRAKTLLQNIGNHAGSSPETASAANILANKIKADLTDLLGTPYTEFNRMFEATQRGIEATPGFVNPTSGGTGYNPISWVWKGAFGSQPSKAIQQTIKTKLGQAISGWGDRAAENAAAAPVTAATTAVEQSAPTGLAQLLSQRTPGVIASTLAGQGAAAGATKVPYTEPALVGDTDFLGGFDQYLQAQGVGQGATGGQTQESVGNQLSRLLSAGFKPSEAVSLIKAMSPAGKALGATQATNLASIDSIAQEAADLGDKMIASGMTGGLGGLTGRTNELLGGLNINPAAKSLQSEINTFAQKAGKVLEGGKLTDADIARYREMLPSIYDDPQTIKDKILSFITKAQNTKADLLSAYSNAGYDMSQFTSGQSQGGSLSDLLGGL